MVCLFAMFAGLFPRIADLIIWLARPALFTTAFKGSWFWPVVGIIFLPFTTLMYVIMYNPVVGLTAGEWVWIGVAVVLDLMHWGHTTYTNRERIPGYTATPSTPSTPAA